MPNLIAVISKYDEDDYSVWFPDIPDDDEALSELFSKHETSGFSVRGPRADIMNELAQLRRKNYAHNE